MEQDFINKRFGRWTIISNKSGRGGISKLYFNCRCDCGVLKQVNAYNLINGLTKSCGCLKKDSAGPATTHGFCKFPEFDIWKAMKQRCYSEKHPSYKRYFSKGITVCDEWKDSFDTFYKDMGPRPSVDHSIDRIENDKGYYKSNCRWATRVEQMNNVSSNVFYTHAGKTKNLTDWCNELGLALSTIYRRIKEGMLFEVAISIDAIRRKGILELNGITKTISDWCIISNISFPAFRARLSSGWTIAEALEPIEQRMISFSIDNTGKPPDTQSLEDWCGLLGLDKNATYLRILRGEAFETVIAE